MRNLSLIWAAILLSPIPALADTDWIATYHVPVLDPALTAYSTYVITPHGELDPSEFSATPSRIEFSLPLWLVGVDKHFALNHVSGNRWSGPGVEGQCDASAGQVACDVQFDPFPIDETKVEAAVRADNSDPATITGRLAVAYEFSGELHGTITIRIP